MILTGLIVLVVVTIGVMFIWNSRIQAKQMAQQFPYVKRRYLCNREERNFFRYLVKAVSRDYMILTKVRIADLVGIDPELSPRKKLDAHERIATRRVDFVLVDRATTEVRVVVELFNDRTSSAQQVQQAIFMDKLFSSARIPLLRFRISENYHLNDLKRAILSTESRYDEDDGPEEAPYAALETSARRGSARSAQSRRERLSREPEQQRLANKGGRRREQGGAPALTDDRPSRIKVA